MPGQKHTEGRKSRASPPRPPGAGVEGFPGGQGWDLDGKKQRVQESAMDWGGEVGEEGISRNRMGAS